MRCPKCGSESALRKRFCANCGAALLILCPECEAESQPGKSFCDDCDGDLETALSAAGKRPAAASRIMNQLETQIQLDRGQSMKRALTALVASTILLTLTTLSSSFGAAQKLSSVGTQTGTAACYSKRLRGHRTSSGQRYDPNALTAAHATIPIGTQVRVTNIDNGRSAVVTVNDHLSAHAGGGIILDISQRACKDLEFPRTGEAKVKLEVLG